MRRMILSLGMLAMFLGGANGSARADEQDEIEARLQAIVKQQQALMQEAQALQKQLEQVKAQASNYVKITVRGKLIKLENAPWYGIRANKGDVMVRFVRTEDKNQQLDEYLKSLEGKEVVAEGAFFRVARDPSDAHGETILDIGLSDEGQIKAVDAK